MNSGGEPERDDTGLPPVDIEIPDDARELDRDVQAYYRERRAERRRLRHRRLRSKISRDGFLLPLLACCLIFALITGTLLTVFTATSDQNATRPRVHPAASPAGSSPPGSARTTRPTAHRPASSTAASAGAASGRPSTTPESSPGSRAVNGGTASASALNPAVVRTRAPLPAGTLRLAGGARVLLQSLGETLLVLVPHACGCGTAVSWLAGIGASHDVQTYLVGTRQTISEANHLHAGLSARLQAKVPVALDAHGLLAHRYPVRGLTAVIVTRHPQASQAAAYAQSLSAADHSAPLVRALSG